MARHPYANLCTYAPKFLREFAMTITPEQQAFVLATDAPRLSPGFLRDLKDGASYRDAERILPFKEVAALKSCGFAAWRLPVERGGAAVSLRHLFEEVIALASADPNLAHIWRNHHMLLERLVLPRTENPVLEQLGKDVAKGALIGLASTEAVRAQTGGKVTFDTRLTPSGAGYRLSGRKFYSTGTIYADHLQVSASHEDGRSVQLVLPRDRAGIEVLDDWTGMGQRLTGTGTTIFHDVKIAPEDIVPVEAIEPLTGPLSSCIAQLFLTGVIAGITEAIAEDATALLAARKATYYFAPSALAKDDPILLQALGEREADAFAARAVVLAAADYLDRASYALQAGGSGPQAEVLVQEALAAAARAKVVTDRIAHAAGSALYDVAGASSTLKEKNLDRHWRNLRTVSSHNPASYKAYALGNRRLNGVALPQLGFF